jgi:adenylate cyclase
MSVTNSLSRAELVLLLETAGKLSLELDQEKLVQTILEIACKLTSSHAGSVLLYDPERKGLFFAAVLGESAKELLMNWGERSNQRVPLAGSHAGKAFTTGRVNLEAESKRFAEVDKQTGNRSHRILSMPLLIGRKSIGVLQVLNKRKAKGAFLKYDARDRALIEHLGRQAASAINNSRLVDKLRAHMGLYSRGGVDDLVERVDQPAETVRLSLLFADMRGFTQLCQSQDARRTQKIVNDLLTMFADEVLTRGGIVNKFLGDAVFAIFRQEDGPKQAVRCAFAMVDKFESLHLQWRKACNADLSFLDIGIGIVTDDVAFGTIGNASVRDFTAIGTPVNLAHAFETAARNGQRILVDQATWNASQDLIASSAKPTTFVLRKPGQKLGVKFVRYHLKRLKPESPVRVFVSHSSQDLKIANLITTELNECGIETWYSVSIVPAENYVEAIQAGLMKSDWIIVIVSRNSIKSDWVKAEVQTGLRDPRFRGRILPIQIDASEPGLINNDLNFVHHLDGRSVKNLGESIRKVLLASETENTSG